MADDLIAMFASITTSDHDALVEQFSKVLQIDRTVSQFFLESSSWNVETAINTFLASVGNKSNLLHVSTRPAGQIVAQPEFVKGCKIEPGTRLTMMVHLKNTGPVKWPSDTRLAFVEGQALTESRAIVVPQLAPGASVFFNMEVGPLYRAGDHLGAYRLRFRGGFISDPIWAMLTVLPAADPPRTYGASRAVGTFNSASHNRAAAQRAAMGKSPMVMSGASTAAPAALAPRRAPVPVPAPVAAAAPSSLFAPSTFSAPAATTATADAAAGAQQPSFTFTGFVQPPSTGVHAAPAAPAFGAATAFGASPFGGPPAPAPSVPHPPAPAGAGAGTGPVAMAMDDDDMMDDL